MTKKDLLENLRHLKFDNARQRNSVVCSLIGHSKIVTTFFGYVNCARCGAQLGDTLAGCYPMKDKVIVGHNCDACQRNYAQMGWKDKLYSPDPFKEEEVEDATN